MSDETVKEEVLTPEEIEASSSALVSRGSTMVNFELMTLVVVSRFQCPSGLS